MTTKYRITFADGKQATMLDPGGAEIEAARASVEARFGRDRIKHIERTDQLDPVRGKPRRSGRGRIARTALAVLV